MRIEILIVLLTLAFANCVGNDEKKHSQISKENKNNVTDYDSKFRLNSLTDFFNNGYTILDSATGDLNKDNQPDLVTVFEFKKGEDTKRIAVIFLLDSSTNKFKKSTTSESLILPPNKHFDSFDSFDDVQIKNGTVKFSQSLTKGWFTTIFRLQNERWELIGYNASIPDNEWISEIDFNLNTGKLDIDKTLIGEDSVSRRINENKIIRPLPSFNNYEPLKIELIIDGSNIWI